MNDLQKKLDGAYNLLAAIPVQGDNVEVMAGIRARLREAFALAGDAAALEKEAGKDGG